MSTTRRAATRRARLSLLAVLSLLLSIPIALSGQTPAFAAITQTAFGTGTAGFSGDGASASNAQLNQPWGVTTDDVGNVYIADNNNHRVRKVDTSGIITTFNGNGSNCNGGYLTNTFGADTSGNCAANAGLIAAAGGMMYMSEGGWLDMIAPTGVKYHVAGTMNRPCSQDADGSVFATCMFPTDATISPGGTSVGAGMFYSSGAYLKGWDLASTLSTVAGAGNPNCNSPAYNGNLAVGACIHPSFPVASGSSIYFFDSMSAIGPRILRIDLNESPLIIHVVAGTGSRSDYYAANHLATNSGISQAGPIAISSTGEIYFGGVSNGVIRKVDTAGYMWDVTGVGGAEAGMAFDRADNLYASVPNQNRVVKVSGLAVAGSGTGKSIVALGDSVSAAEGINYGFIWSGTAWLESGSDNPTWTDTRPATGVVNYPECHQTDYAFSRLLAQQGYTVYNMACTGASAKEGILGPEPFGTESVFQQLGGWCDICSPPNGDYVDHAADKVTITLGPDDVHFADVLKECFAPLWQPVFTWTGPCNTGDNDLVLAGYLDEEKANLDKVLNEIQARGQAAGKVPQVYLATVYDPYPPAYDQSCTEISLLPALGASLTSNEFSWIRSKLQLLNQNIRAEAALYPSFVHLVELEGVMAGHTLCSSTPWVYGPSINVPDATRDNPAPYHPTPDGQRAIYRAMKVAMG